jgi:hypothetical protein
MFSMPTLSIISWLKEKIRKTKRQQQIQPFIQSVDGDEESQVIQLSSPSGVKMNLHWLRLILHFSNETTIQTEILIFSVSPKNLFWARTMYTNEEPLNEKIDSFLENGTFHLLDNQIINFSLDYSTFWVQEITCEHYNNFEEAYQMLFLKLEKNMGEIEQYETHHESPNRRMNLNMYIEENDLFFCSISCNPCSYGTIYVRMKVTRLETTWQIELECPDKRKATAILNDDYEVLNLFLEGHTLFNFLEQISPGNEEYNQVFEKLNELVVKRTKNGLDLDQPILTEEDYEAFNQFVNHKFNLRVSYPPAPPPPDKPILQVVDGSQEERIIKRNGNDEEIPVYSYQVNSLFPNGKRIRGQVISLHEPQTGLFWWTYELYMDDLCFNAKLRFDDYGRAPFLSCYYFDFSKDKITAFALFPFSPFRPSIKIKECSKRYDSFKQANSMLFSSLSNKLDEIEQSKAYTWFERIPLWKYIPQDFFPLHFMHMPSSLKFIPKITSVTKHNDKLQITLENHKKRQVIVILSNDYNVLDIREKSVKKIKAIKGDVS